MPFVIEFQDFRQNPVTKEITDYEMIYASEMKSDKTDFTSITNARLYKSIRAVKQSMCYFATPITNVYEVDDDRKIIRLVSDEELE